MSEALARATQDEIASLEGPLLVAASGGADSTALACLAAAAAPDRVTLAHVEHGWSDAGPALRHAVEALGERLGVPVRVRALPATPARAGVEGGARAARYDALAALADGGLVLTGHTATDDVETALMRLARGTGLRGLGGAQRLGQVRTARVARPLLGWTREQVRSWLTQRAIAWVEDPTNAALERSRNLARHVVLPALSKIGDAAALHRSVDVLRDDAEALRWWASGTRSALTVWRSDEALELHAEALSRLPAPVRRAVLRDATAAVGACAVDRDGIDRLDALVAAKPGSTATARRCRAERGWLHLRIAAVDDPRQPLIWPRPPAAVALEREARFGEWKIVQAGAGEGADFVLDPGRAEGPLVLRGVAPDEPFVARGTGREQAAGAWAAERARSPWRDAHLTGVCDDRGPLWLLGVRPGARAAADPGSVGLRLRVETPHSVLAFLRDPPTLRR